MRRLAAQCKRGAILHALRLHLRRLYWLYLFVTVRLQAVKSVHNCSMTSIGRKQHYEHNSNLEDNDQVYTNGQYFLFLENGTVIHGDDM